MRGKSNERAGENIERKISSRRSEEVKGEKKKKATSQTKLKLNSRRRFPAK